MFEISQEKSEIPFLFSYLNSKNGTYASLAFISGVKIKNPTNHHDFMVTQR